MSSLRRSDDTTTKLRVIPFYDLVHFLSLVPVEPGGLRLELAWTSRDVDGVLPQYLERNDFEGAFVGRGEDDKGRGTIIVRPQPVACRYAPPVSGDEPGKAVLRHGGDQIVADASLVLEKLSSDHGADRVAAQVLVACTATSVSVKAGERVCATRFQLAAEHVAINHGRIIAQEPVAFLFPPTAPARNAQRSSAARSRAFS